MAILPLRIFSSRPNFNIVPRRKVAYVLSLGAIVGSLIALFALGLNLGIDFRGGSLIEVRYPTQPNITELRSKVDALNLGEVTIQEFGEPTDVLVRVQRQGDAVEDQTGAVQKVKAALGADADIRRTEFIGPTVGEELKEAGAIAVFLALFGIVAYVWFRFEWQFAVAGVLALAHDVAITIGLFAVTGWEFNLATVAALLTIAGYSINDTVVVFDRVRENLRKYKTEALPSLLNRSVNDTLSRTVMTSVTTLIALCALAVFGGEVIRNFTYALIWGILIGTYSSIFVAACLLLQFRDVRNVRQPAAESGHIPQPEID
jgi:preprotein translocase SecF subunit